MNLIINPICSIENCNKGPSETGHTLYRISNSLFCIEHLLREKVLAQDTDGETIWLPGVVDSITYNKKIRVFVSSGGVLDVDFDQIKFIKG